MSKLKGRNSLMDKIRLVEQEYTKKEIPDFKVGATIKVMSKILEGDKVRLHRYRGSWHISSAFSR